ncbi:MAG: methyltransferase domain-containing protein [Dehalococcoidia bacterium]
MSSYGDIWVDMYDSVHTLTDDISFWVEEALASDGPVLELGCGTGRVAIPIAQADVPVVGLDNSAEMLKIARTKARRAGLNTKALRFVRGDMRDFSLGQTFPLIIIPFRSFQVLLSVADQYRALATIEKHLAPGGKLVFSLFVPDLELLAGDPSIVRYDHEVTDPATGHQLSVSHQNRYDNFNQVGNVRTIIEEVDKRGEVVCKVYKDFQMRYLYRFEAQNLLSACGYQVLDVYGSFQREPLDESSTEMIWVATPSSPTASPQ